MSYNGHGKEWLPEDDTYLRENVHKTVKQLAEELNTTVGSIRARKTALGIKSGKFKPFTDEEKEKIIEFYKNNPNEMDLESFSKELNRQKTSISRYAKKEGLTNYYRPNTKEHTKNSNDSLAKFRETDYYREIIAPKNEELLRYYAQNKHPRGMLGKHHSEETKKQMSIKHIELCANMTYEEKHEIAMKAIETKKKNGTMPKTTSNAYSRTKSGIRPDLGQYFRSAWEANVARILDYENIEWEYEPKRFFFEEEVDGVASYQPDFYLPQFNKWIEVKGWMDEKSKTRLRLFAEQYPEENKNLILIDQDFYNALRIEFFYLPHWEDYAKYLKRPKKDYTKILDAKGA